MFDKTKKIAALEQKVDELSEENRNLQRQLPDGVAGMAGLSIANYFSQWEQTGYDPYTQIPVQDVDSIERSAISQAINKAAVQALADVKPEILVSYAHKLNPELVESQLKCLTPEVLANAAITCLPREFISAWIATNCDPNLFTEILQSIESKKSGRTIAKEQLEDKGIFSITSLPVGTTVQLLFQDSNMPNNGQFRTGNSTSYLRPGNVSRLYYNTVTLIVTMDDKNIKFVRVDDQTTGYNKETSLQRQIRTSLYDDKSLLGMNNIAFEHSYVAYQTINEIQKKVKLGLLVDAVIKEN